MKAEDTMTAIAAIILAIIGVSTLAVLVSGQAQTAGIIGQIGRSFGYILCTATAPVTGRTCTSMQT